jgi:integral membrane protein
MAKPISARVPAIRSALKLYKIAATITGIMLLLLIIEMVLKYSPTHVELFAGGSGGILWLAPVMPGTECDWYSLFVPGGMDCEITSAGDGVNISLLILISHGWFYVLYLFASFRLWSQMRWDFTRFLLLALGGVVPLLSFFMERRISREVEAYIAEHDSSAQDADGQPA